MGNKSFINLPHIIMETPLKKQVSTILQMYEKEMVKYPYFKMIFSIEESNLHIRIKQRWQNHGLIYEELVNMYMEKWNTKWESMLKARETVCNFYEACDILTKNWQTPFIAIINELDENKILNSNWHKHGRDQRVWEN